MPRPPCRSLRLLIVVSLAGLVATACGAGAPARVAGTAILQPASSAPVASAPGASSPAPSADPPAGLVPLPGSPATPPTPPAASAASAPDCPDPTSGFDCDLQRRFALAQAYVATRPGTVGIVVRDRRTGAVWSNGHAGDLVWTASTVKLAMSVDLLLRDRAHTIELSTEDRDLIQAMLHSSDDHAADVLWSRYGRDDFATRFPDYGLRSITFVDGFPRYWGYMKCTAGDLSRLISYVLDELPPQLRDYIVGQMRAVAPDQQWGVWGAGSAATPGNKDGWSLEQGGWVMNTVGFVGPGQRYTLAVMNSLRGQGGYDDGRQTDTTVARLLFSGRY